MKQILRQDDSDRLLSAMQFRDYVWPNNPTTFETSFIKKTVQNHYPFTNFVEIEELGIIREMKGEGEFVGEGAYEEFSKMAVKCFYGTEAGLLKHPTLAPTMVKMTELKLMQEPTPNYVKYSFTFQENKPPVANAVSIPTVVQNNTVNDAVKLLESTKENADTPITNIDYKIKQGDTLTRIAKQYGTSIDEILKLNKGIKNPNLIIAGKNLNIPVKAK